MNIKKLKLLLFLTAGLIFAGGCGANNGSTDEASQPTPEEAKSGFPAETIHIGVMPANDSLPFLWAEEKGYFAEEGLDVDVEVYTNGQTKQSAIQAGELDGALVALVEYFSFAENSGFHGKVTTFTDGVFPVLESTSYDGSKDVKVGLFEISVINYLADQYLADYNMEKVYINEIPLRLQMIMSGELDMAVLPEPMASTAELKGLTKKVYGNPNDYTPNVFSLMMNIWKNTQKLSQPFMKPITRQSMISIKNLKKEKNF